MNQKVRVRFAPSPTGPLHIGGVAHCLVLIICFAKQQDGDFILRIEDTDSQRFVSGAEEYIQETFDWLGLSFDEVPEREENLALTDNPNGKKYTGIMWMSFSIRVRPILRSTLPKS